MFITNVLAVASQSLVKRKESVSDSESAAVMEGPHQTRSGSFPSNAFGKTKVVNYSFQNKWFDKYKWLHYDEVQDAAYCYPCKTAEEQNKLRTKYKDLASIHIKRFHKLEGWDSWFH